MRFFENAYSGTPTWDIGRPQPAVVRLAEEGSLRGEVLDLGCGTGENALYLAARGLRVVGVDFSAAAIERAASKAAERGVAVEFLVRDALEVDRLGRVFDCAIDVGLFHCLQPADRRRYADAVRRTLRLGGRLFVLAWSDRNPFGRGPERIARSDFRDAFQAGWTVERIEADRLDTNLPEGRVQAWLATIAAT